MMAIAMADITDKATGNKVGVPVNRTALILLKKFQYWRAVYYRLGQGIPVEKINPESLKQAGDYGLSLVRNGKVIYEG